MRLNLWVVVPVAVLTPIVLSYVINQLPELPNKAQNAQWIIAAAIVLSLIVTGIAVVQARSQPGSRMSVRRNRIKGKRNRLSINQPADVIGNLLDGEDNDFSIGEDPSANRRTKP